MSHIGQLLLAEPTSFGAYADFAAEQSHDPYIHQLIQCLNDGTLLNNERQAKLVATQSPLFTLIDGILYYVDPKQRGVKRCVVPVHLQNQLMEEYHSSPMAGHFSAPKLHKSMTNSWWWQGMYSDAVKHCSSCPQCAIVNPSGEVNKPPLHPILVSRLFETIRQFVLQSCWLNKLYHFLEFQSLCYRTEVPTYFLI